MFSRWRWKCNIQDIYFPFVQSLIRYIEKNPRKIQQSREIWTPYKASNKYREGLQDIQWLFKNSNVYHFTVLQVACLQGSFIQCSKQKQVRWWMDGCARKLLVQLEVCHYVIVSLYVQLDISKQSPFQNSPKKSIKRAKAGTTYLSKWLGLQL